MPAVRVPRLHESRDTGPPVPPTGLSREEAARRLDVVGANEIQHQRQRSRLTVFRQQVASPVVWLLGGACVVSALVHEFIDATAIGVIVLLNAFVGFLQEWK